MERKNLIKKKTKEITVMICQERISLIMENLKKYDYLFNIEL